MIGRPRAANLEPGLSPAAGSTSVGLYLARKKSQRAEAATFARTLTRRSGGASCAGTCIGDHPPTSAALRKPHEARVVEAGVVHGTRSRRLAGPPAQPRRTPPRNGPERPREPPRDAQAGPRQRSRRTRTTRAASPTSSLSLWTAVPTRAQLALDDAQCAARCRDTLAPALACTAGTRAPADFADKGPLATHLPGGRPARQRPRDGPALLGAGRAAVGRAEDVRAAAEG